MERPDHNTGDSMPYSFRIVCGLFNVPCLDMAVKVQETGPLVYGPYLIMRRLEHLTC